MEKKVGKEDEKEKENNLARIEEQQVFFFI